VFRGPIAAGSDDRYYDVAARIGDHVAAASGGVVTFFGEMGHVTMAVRSQCAGPSNAPTLAARLVESHVAAENTHDVDAIMQTFGPNARYRDESWHDDRDGRGNVRRYYEEIMVSLPDLHIEIVRRHAADDAIVLEVVISGTHLGMWRGLPATGRRVAIPLCGVFSFDDDDRLAEERIYYDRADALKQLGVLYDPQSIVGRVTTALLHPATMARIVARRVRR
jgi:steroid delta-isomerase-like uncharacterized protein